MAEYTSTAPAASGGHRDPLLAPRRLQPRGHAATSAGFSPLRMSTQTLSGLQSSSCRSKRLSAEKQARPVSRSLVAFPAWVRCPPRAGRSQKSSLEPFSI